MVTIAKETPKETSFWKEYKEEILLGTIAVVVIALIAWGGWSYIAKDKDETARIAATKFNVSGVIENVREEHRKEKFGKGLLEFEEVNQYLFVTLNGVEYEVYYELEDLEFLKTGQSISASGQEGRIDSVSISK